MTSFVLWRESISLVPRPSARSPVRRKEGLVNFEHRGILEVAISLANYLVHIGAAEPCGYPGKTWLRRI